MESSKTLSVSELFYSIQGESTYVGCPCVFIRLSGCNLRCVYCDTTFAFNEEKTSSVDGIFRFAAQYPNAIVEITGGEPLLQPNVHILIRNLIEAKRTVLIETNGTIDIGPVPPEATVIMDIKCPDSGSTALHPNNIEAARKRAMSRADSTEIKFVLSSLKDYAYAKEMTERHLLSSFAPVLFSSVVDRLPIQTVAERILSDGLYVRLQIQLHRIIWPEISRGV